MTAYVCPVCGARARVIRRQGERFICCTACPWFILA